mgnify:CR=1 FL=1
MKNTVVRLWRLSRTPQGLKVVKYTMVSVISALTSLVILTIVFGVLKLWGEVASTLFANIMAGIPSRTKPLTSRAWSRMARTSAGSFEVSTTLTPLAVMVSCRR